MGSFYDHGGRGKKKIWRSLSGLSGQEETQATEEARGAAREAAEELARCSPQLQAFWLFVPDWMTGMAIFISCAMR
jgi:hypothetical protein